MKTEKSFKLAIIATITIILMLGCCLTTTYICQLLLTKDSDASIYVASFNLLVDIAVGILTIWGLTWAAREFRASQERADLDLVFSETGSPKDMTVDLPKLKRNHQPITSVNIGLTNTGTAIGTWYIVHFDIPSDFNVKLNPTCNIFKFISGTYADNWRIAQNTNILRYTFMSNGIIAVYPNYDLLLCQLGFQFDFAHQYRSEYRLSYIIATQDKRKEGFLTLKVKQD